MALGHAVLAALLSGEASGYELAKRFDASVANFWSASPQQLYRELDRLEGQRLLDARVVEQERRPNKRVFTLTQAGRDELCAFTTRPARPMAMRDELLVKLQAVDAGDLDGVMAACADRLERARERLDACDELRTRMLDGASEAEHIRRAKRIGPYLTLLGSRMYEQQHLARPLEVLLLVHSTART